MTERVHFEQWVPVALPRVFRFFSDPRNLPRIMPPRLGAEIVVSVRLLPPLPLRSEWVARIVEYERDHHFADVQAMGPFRHWAHRHEFERRELQGREGTVVRDLLEYDVGLGALGTVAGRLFVGPEMARTFAHRQKTLEALLASP